MLKLVKTALYRAMLAARWSDRQWGREAVVFSFMMLLVGAPSGGTWF
ncbi:MAG: hypothetical protein HY331_02775 [Chloroflexi bacterium]|nr:hypothetical protein [Chloroflexota bacterium]